MTNVSNAYLSQVERDLHRPSIRVLRAIADALELSSEQMMAYAGLTRDAGGPDVKDNNKIDTESAIMRDPRLDPTDRQTLLALYRRLPLRRSMCLCFPALRLRSRYMAWPGQRRCPDAHRTSDPHDRNAARARTTCSATGTFGPASSTSRTLFSFSAAGRTPILSMRAPHIARASRSSGDTVAVAPSCCIPGAPSGSTFCCQGTTSVGSLTSRSRSIGSVRYG